MDEETDTKSVDIWTAKLSTSAFADVAMADVSKVLRGLQGLPSTPVQRPRRDAAHSGAEPPQAGASGGTKVRKTVRVRKSERQRAAEKRWSAIQYEAEAEKKHSREAAAAKAAWYGHFTKQSTRDQKRAGFGNALDDLDRKANFIRSVQPLF